MKHSPAARRSTQLLDGALQRRASDLFDELDEQQQDAARQQFLRLVVIGDSDQRSRRRVPARDIASLSVDPVAMQTVIERFGGHRLLSTAWPTLEGWVDDSRDDLRRHASLTFDDRWQSPLNMPGHTILGDRGPDFSGDVTILRPHFLTDPAQPGAAVGAHEAWPLDDIEGWLDSLIPGIVTTGPQRVEIGGRNAVYFEAEVTDRAMCGSLSYCPGFVVNTIDRRGFISGWSFEPGLHQQVWWVDQGDEPPLVIIILTPSAERDFRAQAAALLDTLVIGDPAPHPIPFEESGIDR